MLSVIKSSWKRCRVIARRYWREFLREERAVAAASHQRPLPSPALPAARGTPPLFLCPRCCRHHPVTKHELCMISPAGRLYIFCDRCSGRTGEHGVQLEAYPRCSRATQRADRARWN